MFGIAKLSPSTKPKAVGFEVGYPATHPIYQKCSFYPYCYSIFIKNKVLGFIE